jgi:hypothetical protein
VVLDPVIDTGLFGHFLAGCNDPYIRAVDPLFPDDGDLIDDGSIIQERAMKPLEGVRCDSPEALERGCVDDGDGGRDHWLILLDDARD